MSQISLNRANDADNQNDDYIYKLILFKLINKLKQHKISYSHSLLLNQSNHNNIPIKRIYQV